MVAVRQRLPRMRGVIAKSVWDCSVQMDFVRLDGLTNDRRSLPKMKSEIAYNRNFSYLSKDRSE